MKYLGPGISYSPLTKLYTAKLGVKNIGSYRTLEEAAKHYNEKVSATFTFPILNKNYVEPEIIEETILAPQEEETAEEILDKHVPEIVKDWASPNEFDTALDILKRMKLE